MVNTFILSASTTPTPDIIAQGLTCGLDAIVHLPSASGVNIVAASALNIGVTGTVTVTVDDMGANLPLTKQMCRTDANGCTSPIGSSFTATVAANEMLTFTVFVTGQGTTIPFDPAHNRLYMRLTDGGGVTRGATAVAVYTDPGYTCPNPSPATAAAAPTR